MATASAQIKPSDITKPLVGSTRRPLHETNAGMGRSLTMDMTVAMVVGVRVLATTIAEDVAREGAIIEESTGKYPMLACNSYSLRVRLC